MSTCNATIEVGGDEVGCINHNEGSSYPHGNEIVGVTWCDSAQGATPHRDPEPPYDVRRGYCVVYGGIVPLRWYGDNRGVAEMEAQRLRESGETPENYERRLQAGVAEQERDEAIAARWAWTERAENYRRALNQIAHPLHPTPTRPELIAIARKALDGSTSPHRPPDPPPPPPGRKHA